MYWVLKDKKHGYFEVYATIGPVCTKKRSEEHTSELQSQR